MRIVHTLIILFSISFFAQAAKKTAVMSDGTQCNYESDNGILNGEYKSYYKNGKLKCEGTFMQNNRFGFWVFYKPDGSIQCIREYQNNYNFQEKSSDNKSKKVALNTNNTWTPIHEKSIVNRTRYVNIVLAKNNTELFANEKLVENILKATKNSGQSMYTDSRFVTKSNSDLLNTPGIVGFKIKEDRIVDGGSQSLHYRIIAIAPLILTPGENTNSPESKGLTEIGWIHYVDIKAELAKMKLSTSKNNPFCTSILDIMEYRNYAVVSEEVTVLNADPAINAQDLAQDKVQEIFDIEKENTLITNNFAAN